MTTATGQREAGPYRVEHWRTYSGKNRWLVRDPDGNVVQATAGNLNKQRVEDMCAALNAASLARSPATGEERLEKVARKWAEQFVRESSSLPFPEHGDDAFRPEEEVVVDELAEFLEAALAAFAPRAGGGK